MPKGIFDHLAVTKMWSIDEVPAIKELLTSDIPPQIFFAITDDFTSCYLTPLPHLLPPRKQLVGLWSLHRCAIETIPGYSNAYQVTYKSSENIVGDIRLPYLDNALELTVLFEMFNGRVTVKEIISANWLQTQEDEVDDTKQKDEQDNTDESEDSSSEEDSSMEHVLRRFGVHRL